jgi:hypothetical protein
LTKKRFQKRPLAKGLGAILNVFSPYLEPGKLIPVRSLEKDIRAAKSSELVERAMLELLNLIKELEIVKFKEFSNPENERFKKEFSGTIHKISHQIS